MLTVALIREMRVAHEELQALIDAASEGNFDEDFHARCARLIQMFHHIEAVLNEISSGA